jgi:hypothetical protein
MNVYYLDELCKFGHDWKTRMANEGRSVTCTIRRPETVPEAELWGFNWMIDIHNVDMTMYEIKRAVDAWLVANKKTRIRRI